jgi:putative transposase
MNYIPQIHHRRSIRLKGYDYSQEGMYFVTICTQDRECLFGKIVGLKTILNNTGKIADECWLQIPEHFPNVILHEHIIMPNHVHGIIELADKSVGVENVGVENFQPLQIRNEFQKIIPCSIGSIIRGYKIGVTKWFRNNVGTQHYLPQRENFQPQHIWQRNYYEHIIRDDQSYRTISDYIINNPSRWNEDIFCV